MLITLRNSSGWWLLGVVWSIALVGIILKLLFINRADKLSVVLYLAMGWLIVIDFNSLISNLPPGGLYWLVAGGLIYTLGAFLYMFEKLPFNHAIFHFLVLAGSFCHFITVFGYL